jgi:16S rRNA (guanine966-N2)-methyltransferase
LEVFAVRVIAGVAKGALLQAQKGKGTRPTSDKVKGALFNILGPVMEESVFLDLFAGSGAIGIEALSRGVVQAVFVEKEASAVQSITKNLHKTGFSDKNRVMPLDVLAALRILGREGLSFDYIFMDPPYKSVLIAPVLTAIKERDLLKRRGIIIVEHAKDHSDWLVDSPVHVHKQRGYGDSVLSFLGWKEQGLGEML